MAVLVVLALAAVLRVMPTRAALPYSSYVDEGHVLHVPAHMVAKSTTGVGTFNDPYDYPTLLADLIAGATEGARLFQPGLKHQAVLTDRTRVYDVIEPEIMIFLGRLIVALMSVGVVLLTMALARDLLGRAGALAAGLVCATLPSLVTRSSIVIVDMPATFFVMLTLYLLERSLVAAERGDVGSGSGPRVGRWLGLVILAGVSAGLASTSKYTSVAVFLAVVAAIALAPGVPVRRRAVGLAASVLAGAAAAVVVMPALVFDTSRVKDNLQFLQRVYSHKSSPLTYVQAIVRPSEVGWVVTVLAVAGLVALVARPRSRRIALAWLAFAVPMSAYLLAAPYQPFRNVLPMVPFLVVAAVAVLVEVAGLARRHLHVPRPVASGAVVLVAVLLAAGLYQGGDRPFIARQIAIVDSRTQAVDWLVAHADPHGRVLVAEQLSILPSQLARIPAKVDVRSAAESRSTQDLARYQYIVVGTFKSTASPWLANLEPPPVATFGKRSITYKLEDYRYNNERILIYRSPQPS